MNFVRKNKLIILILVITLFKGIIWAYIVPSFQAPDEQVHYATIQHYAEPKDYKPKSYDFPIEKTYSFELEYQNLSPELKNLLKETEFAETRFNPDKKPSFNENSLNGAKEKEIRNSDLGRFVERYPVWVTGYPPLYYSMGSFIEKIFSNTSVIERAYLVRFLSSLFGLLAVFIAYFIFRELNFSRAESAMLAGVMSLQPMFTFISSSINIDPLLFLTFNVFILGAVKLLRSGPSIKNLMLIALGIILGLLTKPTAYFLLPCLLFLAILYYFKEKKNVFLRSRIQKTLFFIGLIILGVISVFSFYRKIQSIPTNPKSLSFLWDYLVYQSNLKLILDRSLMYWGDFGWLNIPISEYYIFFIWIVIFLSILGILAYFTRIFKNWGEMDIAKNNKFFQIIYLISMVIGLNLMMYCIGFEQANSGNLSDPFPSIGMQGRYFLPVVTAKFVLIALGLSFIFQKIKRKKLIFFLLVGMIFLNMVSLFDYVIPRFYIGTDRVSFWELLNRMSQYKPLWLKGWGIVAVFILYISLIFCFLKVTTKKVFAMFKR